MKIFKDKIASNAYKSRGVADPNAGQTVYTNDLGPKSYVKHKEAHTAKTKFGMGDHYGTGFKNPIGRMRSDSVGYRPVNREQLGTPPKSVV